MKEMNIDMKLLNVISLFVEAERKPRYYGTNAPIHSAEIRMLRMVREHEGIHVGGLAEILGVTKGAVSALLRKLERKGLIVKETDAYNLSKLNIHLTDKGEIAHEHHLRYHEQIDEIFKEILCQYSPKEIDVLHRFLDDMLKEDTKSKFEHLQD